MARTTLRESSSQLWMGSRLRNCMSGSPTHSSTSRALVTRPWGDGEGPATFADGTRASTTCKQGRANRTVLQRMTKESS